MPAIRSQPIPHSLILSIGGKPAMTITHEGVVTFEDASEAATAVAKLATDSLASLTPPKELLLCLQRALVAYRSTAEHLDVYGRPETERVDEAREWCRQVLAKHSPDAAVKYPYTFICDACGDTKYLLEPPPWEGVLCPCQSKRG